MKHDRKLSSIWVRESVALWDTKIALIRAGVPATAQELMAIIEKREYELSKKERFGLMYAK